MAQAQAALHKQTLISGVDLAAQTVKIFASARDAIAALSLAPVQGGEPATMNRMNRMNRMSP